MMKMLLKMTVKWTVVELICAPKSIKRTVFSLLYSSTRHSTAEPTEPTEPNLYTPFPNSSNRIITMKSAIFYVFAASAALCLATPIQEIDKAVTTALHIPTVCVVWSVNHCLEPQNPESPKICKKLILI
jgi:hypothetical protein